MKHSLDHVVYADRRIARRWPPFQLDVFSSGDGTFIVTEKGSSLAIPFSGCGIVFVMVAVVMPTWLPLASGLVWVLLAVGTVTLLGGGMLAASRRILSLDTKTGSATLYRRLGGAEFTVCTADQVRITTCRVDLAIRWSVLPPWRGFMAVVWMTPQYVFPLAAGRDRADVERYLHELPPEVRKLWSGDGPTLLANY